MDIDQNAESTGDDHRQEKTKPSDVAATETEASENRDKKPGITTSPTCLSVTKCENESTSWARAEGDKPNCEESNGSSKESSQQNLRNTGSPDPGCSICLGKMENKSFTNSCFHQFCFACLLEWSKVKPECPLCKQPLKSIVHNVRSMEDYDQYHLRLDDLNTWENPDGRRFRYRSTLTAERRRELALGRFLMSHRMPSRTLDLPRSNGRHLLTTSDYRKHIYETGLWVRAQPATRSSRYREASPAFYAQNPACTHRLIPWLNRELNALEYGHQVAFLMELILSLIQRFHIQSPEFRELVQPYFLANTNHFIHELYNFARSPHDMVDYDRHVSYDDHFSLIVEDTDSDSDVIVLSPDRSSRPRWSQRGLQSSPRTLTTSRDHPAVLNRARDFLDRVSILGSLSLHTLPPSTSTTATPSTSTVPSPEPGPSGLQSTITSRSHGVPRLRSVITVPTPRPQGVKTEVTVTEEDEDDDCMIIGYEEPVGQRKPLDVIILSDSDDDVILDTPVPTTAAAEPSLSVGIAPQSPETQDDEKVSSVVDRRCGSSSTTRHTSQSPSPVRQKKGSKRHKRSKTRRSRSTSRSRLSPSAQSSSSHKRHHEKRRHKKHSSKSSGHSKSSSSQQDAESSEHSHSHHKSSKKKHSRKHKSSKSREDHQTSSP